VDWLYLEHKETGGITRVADEPGVLEWHEARGWAKADEPEPVPFVPPKGDAPPGDDEWVELVHSVTGHHHDFPNNPEALQGAYEAGWELPKPPKPAKAKKSASVAPATDNDESKGVTTSG
jgi:hypothetical protein